MMEQPMSELHRGKEQAVKAFERGGPLPIRERAAVTVRVASEFSGISRTRIYELLDDGTLLGKTVRGRRLVFVPSLLRLVGGDRAAA
jgi:hypothetical protein